MISIRERCISTQNLYRKNCFQNTWLRWFTCIVIEKYIMYFYFKTSPWLTLAIESIRCHYIHNPYILNYTVTINVPFICTITPNGILFYVIYKDNELYSFLLRQFYSNKDIVARWSARNFWCVKAIKIFIRLSDVGSVSN